MLLGAWEKALANGERSKWPVIVIDEVNVLMGWDKYSVERATLLRYFVQVTKQEKRCHVLMATSEYGFQAWLNDG